MPPSRRFVIVATLGLGACATLAPREIVLSQADLQALMERHFPRERRLLELVDVTLARPSIRLVPERNRIVTALELVARERVSGRTLRGSLALDHTLRYEASDGTVRLASPRVERLDLDAAGSVLSGQGARLGGLLVERLLDDAPLHRLSDERRAMLERAGIGAADVHITSRGVEIRFGPPAR
jgi:hypothetical protein